MRTKISSIIFFIALTLISKNIINADEVEGYLVRIKNCTDVIIRVKGFPFNKYKGIKKGIKLPPFMGDYKECRFNMGNKPQTDGTITFEIEKTKKSLASYCLPTFKRDDSQMYYKQHNITISGQNYTYIVDFEFHDPRHSKNDGWYITIKECNKKH